MKRWLAVALAVIIAVAVCAGVSYWRAKQFEKEHQAAYETKLAGFQSALQPGMSREQVEDYLRGKGLPFQRSCCESGVFSDLTKIGQNPPNWVCRGWNVYVEFKFENALKDAQTATPSDRLKSMDLYQKGICL